MNYTHVYNWGIECLWFMSCVIALIPLLILVSIFIKWTISTIRRKAAIKKEMNALLDEQGRRLPPSNHGLCQQCKHVFDDVFFLPDGSVLCRQCYKRKESLHV